MDRRSFVKGAVGAGLVGAAAAGGYLAGRQTTLSIEGPTGVPYVGAKSLNPIAPRGLPLLPLEVDDAGRIHGRVLSAPEGGTTLAWYQYCGHEDAPGLQEERGDDVLRFFETPDRLAQGYNPWYRDRIGDEVQVTDFPEPGFGAHVVWRSEGETGADILVFVLLRTGTDTANIAGTGRPLTFEDVPSAYERLVRSQIEDLGFVALFAACTHFCCVAGWKEAPSESYARSKDAWDKVFCTCHGAIYDPATYTRDRFWVSPDA